MQLLCNLLQNSVDKCFLRGLVLPAGQKILFPFQMALLSNDFSQLPPIEMMEFLII